MEPDDLWNVAHIEMAVNRVADFVMQIDQPIGLGEDRFTQGARGEAAGAAPT
jgi:hypothetical protein